jgi:hypothetical protein
MPRCGCVRQTVIVFPQCFSQSAAPPFQMGLHRLLRDSEHLGDLSTLIPIHIEQRHHLCLPTGKCPHRLPHAGISETVQLPQPASPVMRVSARRSAACRRKRDTDAFDTTFRTHAPGESSWDTRGQSANAASNASIVNSSAAHRLPDRTNANPNTCRYSRRKKPSNEEIGFTSAVSTATSIGSSSSITVEYHVSAHPYGGQHASPGKAPPLQARLSWSAPAENGRVRSRTLIVEHQIPARRLGEDGEFLDRDKEIFEPGCGEVRPTSSESQLAGEPIATPVQLVIAEMDRVGGVEGIGAGPDDLRTRPVTRRSASRNRAAWSGLSNSPKLLPKSSTVSNGSVRLV